MTTSQRPFFPSSSLQFTITTISPATPPSNSPFKSNLAFSLFLHPPFSPAPHINPAPPPTFSFAFNHHNSHQTRYSTTLPQSPSPAHLLSLHLSNRITQPPFFHPQTHHSTLLSPFLPCSESSHRVAGEFWIAVRVSLNQRPELQFRVAERSAF